jgi:hypothetical protein
MPKPSQQDASTVAVAALTYLATRQDRLEAFVRMTGLDPAQVRDLAKQPDFQGGVLDFMLNHETDLLDFCEQEGLTPQRIQTARTNLPGGRLE